MKTDRAKMPKQITPMFIMLSLHCAKCAKTDYGTRKPLTVPKCHIIIGYGIGTAAWIKARWKQLLVALSGIANHFHTEDLNIPNLPETNGCLLPVTIGYQCHHLRRNPSAVVLVRSQKVVGLALKSIPTRCKALWARLRGVLALFLKKDQGIFFEKFFRQGRRGIASNL